MYKYILLSKDYPNTYIISIYFIVYALVAQLGRASDYKSESRIKARKQKIAGSNPA